MNTIENLEQLIQYHNNLYYDKDTPEISDYEYDKLVEKLKNINPESPVLQYTGTPQTKKIKHDRLMGSLSKGHSSQEIIDKLLINTECSLIDMPKIDGCSLSIKYKNSKLYVSITRGDGIIGEDVTNNVKQISNVPQKLLTTHNFNIDKALNIEIRGEVYVNRDYFLKNFSNDFENPRNFAAGSLKQKDFNVTKERNLSFVAYELYIDNYQLDSKSDELIYLEKLGFEIPIQCNFLNSKSIYDVENVILKYDDLRKKLPYDIDGIVFRIDNNKIFNSLGYNNKYPNGAIAYKFNTEKAISTIESIEWNVSRTGKIIPVALLTPTYICGSTVSRMTLNNIDFIRVNDISIGDTIQFEKANEIIPKFVSVVSRPKNRSLNIPTNCPSCNDVIKYDENNVYILCTNNKCLAKLTEKLTYFIKQLNVKGISTKTIEKILNVDNKCNLFSLSIDDLISIGFGETQSHNIIKALSNIEITESEFFGSLGIESASKNSFEKILKIKDFNYIINNNLTIDDLISIDGIGEKSANYIINSLNAEKEFIKTVLQSIKIKHTKINTNNKLDNKSFCITGILSKGRTEFEKIIKENGGIIASVSKKLDYLIVGEESGSKLDKARKLGITLLTEQEFLKLL